MHRLSVVLLSLIILVEVGRADSKVRMGFTAGLGIASQTYSYDHLPNKEDRDRLDRAAFAMDLEIAPRPWLALLLETSYAPKGSQQSLPRIDDTGAEIVDVTFKTRVNYLTFVFAVKGTADLGPVKAFVLGGPRLDVKLSIDDDREGLFFDSLISSYKPAVAGLTAGFGLERPVSDRVSLVAQVRYDYDLDISADFAYMYWNDWIGWDWTALTIDNRYSSVTAGLIFEL